MLDDFLAQFKAKSKWMSLSVSNHPGIPQGVSFTDAAWGDNDNAVSAANPHLAPEFDDFSLYLEQVLGHDRTLTYLSTDSLPRLLE